MLILDKWSFCVLIKNDFVSVEAINKILLKLVGLKISFAVDILLNLGISGFLARFIGVHRHGGGWEEE
jgi:hypothetical protein